jgi:hypothetical protein
VTEIKMVSRKPAAGTAEKKPTAKKEAAKDGS